MTPAARCCDLRKRYDAKKKPVDALNGLDLEIRVGECFGLLGPNGAGKTTTVEILEGLLKQTSGHVEVLARQWNGRDDHDIRQRIGISLQETRFSEKLTVRETITLFRSFHHTGRDPGDVVDMVDLNEKADARVGKLSGGQKQRLAVACALVGDPELLFLDEPTTGLDPQSRREIWDIVREQRSRSRTTLITTHYMDEAQRLCDRVAVVDHGRVIALGSPDELIHRIGGEHIVEFALARDEAYKSPLAQGGFTPQCPPLPTGDSGGSPPGGPADFKGLKHDASSTGRTTRADVSEDTFADLPAVSAARRESDGYSLTVSQPHVALPALINKLQTDGLELARLTTRHVSLEDVFVTLTGRHLRDEEPSSD